MKSPKPEISTYTMPLAELLDLLGTTRRTTERPPRSRRDRRPPPAPVTPPDEQPKTDA
jgi:hypothetical protein